MQFIVSGERIATENFSIGKVYTVTFTNGNYFVNACVGIGPDFVMFQQESPKMLFCLDMESAETVSSIDESGGGAVTMNYNELDNKPSINGVTLIGNKTAADLSILPVPIVGENDNNKILTASYSGGVGSYSWQPAPSSGTTDYTQLTNKPQINSVELEGNKSLADLGIASAEALAGYQTLIDSSHKLSSDLVDDTGHTNKFATAAQLAQIATNTINILYINDEVNGRQFSFTNGASIVTDVSVGDIIDITPTSSVSWAYTIVPVVYGETIIITGQGGNNARLWAFADNEYRLVSKSIGNNTLNGADISVPLGASYCIINSTISSLGFCGIIGFKEDIYNLKKFRPIENLVDKNDADMIIGGYIDTNGARQTNASLDQSGYIPVVSGEYYTSTQNNTFVLWYDENKTLIGNTPAADVDNNGTCKAISGASYGRWITTVANYATWKVAKGRYLNNTGVAFGTSLTYRAQSTGGYLQYLPDLIGEPIDNHGIGNATILTSETTPQLNILSEIKSYTDYTKKNFCIIEGFVNDWVQHADKLGIYTDTEETTVCGCVRSAINYILTQNPDINLLLILDHVGTGVNASTYKFNNLTQFEFYNEIAKVAESMSVPVCKGYELSQMNEYSADYFIDNIHPTDKGASHFAHVINDNYKNIAIKQ